MSNKNEKVIMIVDDNQQLRDLLGSLIEDSYGYEVIQAENGFEALNHLTKRGSDIDMAFIDYEMPQMTGEELITEITERFPDHPMKTCMLTGNFGGDDMGDFLGGRNVDAFVYKPFDPDQVETTIKTLLAAPPNDNSIVQFVL